LFFFNSSIPGIANEEINNNVPGMITDAAEIIAFGVISLGTVTRGVEGSVEVTLPTGYSAYKTVFFSAGGTPLRYAQIGAIGSPATIIYFFEGSGTVSNRSLYYICFTD
jgi:hypothetical protein